MWDKLLSVNAYNFLCKIFELNNDKLKEDSKQFNLFFVIGLNKFLL